MKTKEKEAKHSFSTISIRFNKEEQAVIYKLKDDHGINICGLIKILLKKKLEQLEQLEKLEQSGKAEKVEM
jgi:hypothetical protein